ncbi:MAG: hypothetical protein J5616_04345 [Bacteroidaceae bacterium]|nr:hypothetical protein [Bacteroidaceae bacterium]
MIDDERTYSPLGDEDALTFVRRVIAEQPDPEPLRIVEALVKIAVGELKDCPCQCSAATSPKCLKVTLRHRGQPIDERMIEVMGNHTDHVDYDPDGCGAWQLVIRRDIPPLYVQRE